MKIAIACEKDNLEAEVSSMGGRAPYYLIFENSELIETIKNPFASGGGGAGFSAAYMLAEKGVTLVVAGGFGGNMQDALKERGIQSKEIDNGVVGDIVKEL